MKRQTKTMDGNSAAAYVSYAYTDVAAIYPITPSSNMAEETDKMATAGVKNLFGQTVKVTEMQSEGGAAGAVHGSLTAGALTATYTASQGLLLMIPNMYKIAGELLPGVINVSARAIASHALSIFGDHSDIYSCRQTGFAMLCSNNPQQVMDLGAVAHLSAIKGRVPFVHFFDGFRTSHEIQKIECWDYKDLGEMLDWDAVNEFRRRSLNPEHPVQRGTAQNPDIFFQAREASNKYYNALPDIVEEYMNKVNEKLGTDYKPFNYYGAADAEHVIVVMGSVCGTVEETVDYLNAKGEKVGVVEVHLYRPFSVKHLLSVLPDSVKKIAVLDRTKEPGSIGEPLYLDVVAALHNTKFDKVSVIGGRYGLGSKDTTPAQIIAVYRNLEGAAQHPFTIGIEDDVTNLSLATDENPDTTPEGTTSCKFWGLGADGTVGANKNSIKIIGDNTDMYAQGYFDYDSKKSGGITISHLRFGKKEIKSTYLINKADFVACHNPSYVDKYDMVQDIKKGGIFLLNCSWTADELSAHLPAAMKNYIAANDIQFYTIDATAIAKELGLGGRVNTILQAAFFSLSGIIESDKAVELMKAAALKSYGKKGEKVVNMNYAAIERGISAAVKVEIPADWATAVDAAAAKKETEGDAKTKAYVDNILTAVNAQKGNKLPVSAFEEYVDGTVPLGTSAYEKRGIAVDVPEWQPENCIQCNFCSYVCPHAVIRPVVMNEQEAAAAPAATKTIPMTGLAGLQFGITATVLDCTGCGSCVNVCPGKKGAKALVMKPLASQLEQQEVYNYAQKQVEAKPEVNEKFKVTTVKGSQFKQPLLEFSGACAGCGETPYLKMITQLYGDHMRIANSAGCTHIWGGSPEIPFCTNDKGRGVAWASGLFEDTAEYGYGMYLGTAAVRKFLKTSLEDLAGKTSDAELKAAIEECLANWTTGNGTRQRTDRLIAALEATTKDDQVNALLERKDYLYKTSQWIVGGDGWAYDIGYSGLDHVIASGENVNILCVDTEVYSNTGGQASKSTQTAAVAQFAAAGKKTKKKDLGRMCMSYGYVYVAQVAMGYDPQQVLNAIKEAEAFDGPSVIIAYAPCINHGIKGGMSNTQLRIKEAVECGYWHAYRFNPDLKKEGKNPFILDSKAPDLSKFRDFLMKEVRYTSLQRKFPDTAEALYAKAQADAQDRTDIYLALAAGQQV